MLPKYALSGARTDVRTRRHINEGYFPLFIWQHSADIRAGAP